MADKFIPDSDSQFADMAQKFARVIERHETHYHLSGDDVQAIVHAAAEFADKLALATRPQTRTEFTRRARDAARVTAERIIRKYGRIIRADERISQAEKIPLGVKERPAKLGKIVCPQTRPILLFKGALNPVGTGGPRHKLYFVEQLGGHTSAKPPGAARVELFVELVAEDEPIPKHPGELSNGRPWYLQSFTRNPIEVEFPMPHRPMRVVYWARWADAKGTVGPFSLTCVATVEGWPHAGRVLPDYTIGRQRQQRITVRTVRPELPDYRDELEEAARKVAGLLAELPAR